MVLILKSENEKSLSKIMALAEQLDITIENPDRIGNKKSTDELKMLILSFKAQSLASFEDAAEWQSEERKDRKLPFVR